MFIFLLLAIKIRLAAKTVNLCPKELNVVMQLMPPVSKNHCALELRQNVLEVQRWQTAQVALKEGNVSKGSVCPSAKRKGARAACVTDQVNNY